MIFDIVHKQIIKHDSRYLNGSNLIRSIYTEMTIVKITIRFLSNTEPLPLELLTNYCSYIR